MNDITSKQIYFSMIKILLPKNNEFGLELVVLRGRKFKYLLKISIYVRNK